MATTPFSAPPQSIQFAAKTPGAACVTEARALRAHLRRLAAAVDSLERNCPEILTKANVERVMNALLAIDTRIAEQIGDPTGAIQPQVPTLVPPPLRLPPPGQGRQSRS